MGCRKFQGRQWTDDLDGQTHLPEELEEIVFVFDGQAKVIHLNRENAAAFRASMSPYSEAAQPTTKSRVLSTLPRKSRHLSIVPPSPSVDSEPEGDLGDSLLSDDRRSDPRTQEESQNSPISQKGEAVEALSEPEGTRVPETPSKPLDSRPPDEPAKTVSSVAPLPEWTTPQAWAQHAPNQNDDQLTKVRKVRAWATALAVPTEQTLIPEMFQQYDKFYREQGWLNL